MKKVLLSVVITLILLWNCGTAFPQGKRKDPNSVKGRIEGERETDKGRRSVDPNVLRREAELKRLQNLGQERDRMRQLREKQRKDLMKRYQERREERERFLKGAGAERLEGEFGEGVDHQQQLKALQTQMAKEDAKHLKRMARLKRIEELAAGEDSKQIATRIVKLRRREQQRYGIKRERMQRRMHMLLRMQQEGQNIQPPDEKRLSEEARKAMMEKLAGAEKSKGKAEINKEDTGTKTE